ncbi:hypothetical protein [Nocardia brasiliensis]|uniref:MarR family transcriptional regulator n=1 Tax=Nocardia brasiliensis TaxID=37326 RepID=UPI00366EC725
MSTTSTTTTDTRTAHENALWLALTDHPGITTTELAKIASVPKTTARKIVATWAGEGLVTRANDGDDRSGFRWRIVADEMPETGSAATGPAPQPAPGEPAPALQDVPAAEPATTAEPEPTPDTDTDTQPVDEHLPEDSGTGTDTTPDTAEPISPTSVTNTPGTDVATDTATDDAAGEGDSVQPAAADSAVKGVCPTCGQRLKQSRGPQPGALRALVEDFLRDHPGEEFTPGQIAKELGGKSSGAVYNACFVLVGKFVAEHTCERPNRFKLHPTQEQQQAQEQQQQ